MTVSFTPSPVEIAEICVNVISLVAMIYLLVKQLRNKSRAASLFSRSQFTNVGPISLAVACQLFQIPYTIFNFSVIDQYYTGVLMIQVELFSVLSNIGFYFAVLFITFLIINRYEKMEREFIQVAQSATSMRTSKIMKISLTFRLGVVLKVVTLSLFLPSLVGSCFTVTPFWYMVISAIYFIWTMIISGVLNIKLVSTTLEIAKNDRMIQDEINGKQDSNGSTLFLLKLKKRLILGYALVIIADFLLICCYVSTLVIDDAQTSFAVAQMASSMAMLHVYMCIELLNSLRNGLVKHASKSSSGSGKQTVSKIIHAPVLTRQHTINSKGVDLAIAPFQADK